MDKSEKKSQLITITNLPVVAHGSLEEYIRFVNSIPLLTSSEEYTLAEKWQNDEDIEAARYLVLSHLRLVVSIARNYTGYGLPLADVIQEGTIGLMKAVKRFDPKRGVRLVTFAMHWIRAEINEYVIKNWRIVRTVTTKSQRKLFFSLRSHRSDIGNLSEAEADRLAEQLNVTRDDIVDMNMRLTGSDVGLMSDEKDGFAPQDWLEDKASSPEYILEKNATDKLHTEGIESALQKLDDRSRDIICSRWLADPDNQQTLMELAKKYGVSAERIRQIEVRAMQKMKEFLQEYR
ncbi:MAG: RNA polymerase sigma factor RpoH [Proteobacteria bacterium]|nr:RNA polymerase sigma factor RpoH [Pseudomonadota bacterium]